MREGVSTAGHRTKGRGKRTREGEGGGEEVKVSVLDTLDWGELTSSGMGVRSVIGVDGRTCLPAHEFH